MAPVARSPYLTSGDLARLLSVDLKTVHNWVTRGHLTGWRTRGRHLRFRRTELLRFMRRFGYPIPATLGEVPIEVVIVQAANGKPPNLGVHINPHHAPSLAAAALELASGEYEALVIDLDRYTAAIIDELVTALRSRDATRGVAVVGLARDENVQARFLRRGGLASVVTGDTRGLVAVLRYLVGGGPPPSNKVRLNEPNEPE